VDDLKAKLAAQEVELKQKNDDADKLIQVRSCLHVEMYFSVVACTVEMYCSM
jgi:hypothetical protein